MNKQTILNHIDANAETYIQTADSVWNFAETAYRELHSQEALCSLLKKEGFTVTRGIGGISTAFSASFGSGSPRIGILAEYDALPGMSQKADVFLREEEPSMENGHGCGHHLLGAGSLAAACAVRKALLESGQEGTVIYFGCPAEEGESGKSFMARAGVFDGLDAAVTWHPSSYNAVVNASTLANYKATYTFHGVSAHAAMAPHLGRSALDALEMMNIGANFLREHIIPQARLHYAITNTGGEAANIVQAEAQVVYVIRAPHLNQVQEIYERLNKVAQGAAMMTETTCDIHLDKTCADIISNPVLEQILHNNLTEVTPPGADAEELAYARNMLSTLPKKNLDLLYAVAGKEVMMQMMGETLHTDVIPYVPKNVTLPGSSDVGDVSWNVPAAQICTACFAVGTPEHSWQMVAQGKSSTAHKNMLYAGKVLACAAADLFDDPKLMASAREAFEKALNGKSYKDFI